jgi:hypothetical protein
MTKIKSKLLILSHTFNNCPLLTGDPEFKSLEKKDIIDIE